MRCPAACLALLVLLLPASGAAQWSQIGPYGGDVRALAADPSNFSQLFLGTSNGQIYASANAGRSWIRWSQVAPGAGYVVDDILVDAADPRVMYVGAWQAGVNGGGGVFKSTDGGRSWHALRDMAGRSVRALVQARHRSHLLVAGWEVSFAATPPAAPGSAFRPPIIRKSATLSRWRWIPITRR